MMENQEMAEELTLLREAVATLDRRLRILEGSVKDDQQKRELKAQTDAWEQLVPAMKRYRMPGT